MKGKLHFKLFSSLLFAILIVAAVSLMWQRKQQKWIYIEPEAEKLEKNGLFNDPDRRAQYEFDLLKNPATGKIPDGIRAQELAEAARMPLKEGSALNPSFANAYSFAGPSNFGGRVRSVVFDVRYNGTTNQTVFAGGVSGGVFKSTDGGTNWTRVTPNNVLYSVTCIAQDPRPGFQNTWYYGSGESLGNSTSATGAFYVGFGMYKSIDNGVNWTKILNTPDAEGTLETFDTRFDIVGSLQVNPINGDLYAGILNGVVRLPFGTTTWVDEKGFFGGNSNGIVDLKIGSNGIVYASIPGNGTRPISAATIANEGVWRRDLAGTWTRIAGAGTPAWFNQSTLGAMTSTLNRIVLAIDPNDEKNVYALYWNGTTSQCAGTPAPEAEFGKYDTLTATWVDLSAALPDETGCTDGNDPFAVQGGYDLMIAVKPGNSNVIFMGGTNIYRLTSANIFIDATYTVTRAGGYVSAGSAGRYLNSHPDMHSVAFQPGSPNIMLCGNDGGIQRTTDNTAGTVAWTDVSNGFATYQYYYVAIDPTSGSTKYIGGAQDNGTTYRDAGTNAFVKSMGGDGVSVGISAGNTMHFVGFQDGVMFRKNPAFAEGFISANLTTGAVFSPNRLFITLFHLDEDNTENLYYVDFNELWRCPNATTALNFSAFTELTGIRTTIGAVNIRSLATSRGAYSAATSKLYFGTLDGRVYRVDDPLNVAPATAPVQINLGAGMPASNILGLSVNPRNSDTVIAVYSNYGVNSIWWCGNATTGAPTWTNVEGNLTTPSIRTAMIAVTSSGVEYYVGTTTGLYSTTTLSGGATVWSKEGSTSIGNAVVNDIAYRPVDNTMVVGTHGNGMFAANIFALPVTLKRFEGRLQGNSNYLFWTVENEIDNAGFEIQRKYPDELGFTRVGFIVGRGNSTARNDYSFSDNIVDLGKNASYRLKQIDLNGRYNYSATITLNRKSSDIFIQYVSVGKNSLLIRTNSGNGQESLTLRIFDASGKLLKQSRIAYQSQQVDLSNLPHATLLLDIIHPDGRRFTKKLVY